MILLVVLAVILLVVGGTVYYFYDKYEEEIGVFLELKDEADVLFDAGILGPDDCSSFYGCGKYCISDEEACVEFCENNPENELCVLVVDSVDSGELDLESYGDDFDLDG